VERAEGEHLSGRARGGGSLVEREGGREGGKEGGRKGGTGGGGGLEEEVDVDPEHKRREG